MDHSPRWHSKSLRPRLERVGVLIHIAAAAVEADHSLHTESRYGSVRKRSSSLYRPFAPRSEAVTQLCRDGLRGMALRDEPDSPSPKATLDPRRLTAPLQDGKLLALVTST